MPAAYLTFTKPQAEALLHRLECGDCLAEVFADTDGMEHLAPRAEERAGVLAKDLRRHRKVLALDELDRALLCEAVEGSTYVAAQMEAGYHTFQSRAALRCLQKAARVIEAGLELTDPLEVPEA